jgi:hypothetical protein
LSYNAPCRLLAVTSSFPPSTPPRSLFTSPSPPPSSFSLYLAPLSPTTSPLTLLSLPRVHRETECCTYSAQLAVLYLSHLPHSAVGLFLCLVPSPPSLSIRTTPPVYVQSSLRFLPPCRPVHLLPVFSPNCFIFLLVSLTESPADTSVLGSPPDPLSAPGPRMTSKLVSSQLVKASFSARVSVSSSPFPTPFFVAVWLQERREEVLVTSCAWARGPEAIPASNERLTLHAVLDALPSYPTAVYPKRNFSACPSRCAFDT